MDEKHFLLLSENSSQRSTSSAASAQVFNDILKPIPVDVAVLYIELLIVTYFHSGASKSMPTVPCCLLLSLSLKFLGTNILKQPSRAQWSIPCSYGMLPCPSKRQKKIYILRNIQLLFCQIRLNNLEQILSATSSEMFLLLLCHVMAIPHLVAFKLSSLYKASCRLREVPVLLAYVKNHTVQVGSDPGELLYPVWAKTTGSGELDIG